MPRMPLFPWSIAPYCTTEPTSTEVLPSGTTGSGWASTAAPFSDQTISVPVTRANAKELKGKLAHDLPDKSPHKGRSLGTACLVRLLLVAVQAKSPTMIIELTRMYDDDFKVDVRGHLYHGILKPANGAAALRRRISLCQFPCGWHGCKRLRCGLALIQSEARYRVDARTKNATLEVLKEAFDRKSKPKLATIAVGRG